MPESNAFFEPSGNCRDLSIFPTFFRSQFENDVSIRFSMRGVPDGSAPFQRFGIPNEESLLFGLHGLYD